MKWTFAKNDGGQDRGFHDAGVETFKGNFDRYLARELIQNSLDARYDPNQPVLVKFDVIEVNRKDIPDIDYLKATLARCAEYWSHDAKAKKFFERAESLAREPKITVLKVEDMNTTGVLGSDTDKHKNWYNLVRCSGASSKGGGEGGSFGIGKNAPFAASYMRTVLYSTNNIEDEVIFQGVALLASHDHPDGGVAQPTGFLGGDKGRSIRRKTEIPTCFRKNNLGTNIYVLGFPNSSNWEKDLTFSVLDNFWPAIYFGDLAVRIGSLDIKKASLPGLLESYSREEKFTAHIYFKAFTDPSNRFFRADLKNLKEVSLYLLAADTDMPKKVAMTRKTGMIVMEKHFRSIIPYAGVFLCRNDIGNGLLRDMEPPKHDTWDPDHPEKGANRKIEHEYADFIRDCIKKLAPIDDAKVISIPDLYKYLPDDNDTPESDFDDAHTEDGGNKQETPDRSPLPEIIPGKKIVSKKSAMQPDATLPGDGNDETEIGEPEEDGSGSGSGNDENDTDGGKAGAGGGQGNGNSKSSHGNHGGVNSKPAIPIKYRTFSQNPAGGKYIVSITSEKLLPVYADVVLWFVGDDQRVQAEVSSARVASTGEDVKVRAGGTIGPIKLAKEGKIKLEVVLREPIRVAMEVSAHEA